LNNEKTGTSQVKFYTARSKVKSRYIVGWVDVCYPTKFSIMLGFAVAQPNLHFLNRIVLG